MSWEWFLFMLVGGFLLLLFVGVPVGVAFIGINAVGMLVAYGGEEPLRQLALSFYSSVAKFALVPVPLFILMGEIMFHSGVAQRMMRALDEWIGSIPGRLSLLGIAGGVIFAALCGSSTASSAMLGSVLVPEMRKQGYSPEMSIGPILGAGTLAAMIPPTALGVLLASLAQISVADFLLAIIVPGLIMAAIYAAYIITRAYVNPRVAPRYEHGGVPLHQKLKNTLMYVVPLGSVIFLVIGLMILGVATPNEAAALGALGCFVLAVIYQHGIKWDMLKRAIGGTLKTTGMLFLIFGASTAFTQLLAFSGVTQAFVDLAVAANLGRLGMIAIMMVILLIMGCLMEPLSILMLTVPLFLPVARALGIDLMALCVLMLVNMEAAVISPPFGMSLFVMKGVVPDVSMTTIWKSALPFIACIVVVIVILMFAPQLTLWLPSVAGAK